MRFLYLDDSGKPDANHPSQCLAFAGFSVDESNWHSVVRQVSGAKAMHFPRRGRPADWELKSSDFLTRNAWNRANNRRFCLEVVDILKRNGCSVYAISLIKANCAKPLHESWIVPKCFQVLAAKFACELATTSATGTIVCDWSTHSSDRHVSNCVQSFVLSHALTSIIGGVTYASSMALATVQVCDLIAGAVRITAEGGNHLAPLMTALRGLAFQRAGLKDVLGYPASSETVLF